jgi:hypothetical protein
MGPGAQVLDLRPKIFGKFLWGLTSRIRYNVTLKGRMAYPTVDFSCMAGAHFLPGSRLQAATFVVDDSLAESETFQQ